MGRIGLSKPPLELHQYDAFLFLVSFAKLQLNIPMIAIQLTFYQWTNQPNKATFSSSVCEKGSVYFAEIIAY